MPIGSITPTQSHIELPREIPPTGTPTRSAPPSRSLPSAMPLMGRGKQNALVNQARTAATFANMPSEIKEKILESMENADLASIAQTDHVTNNIATPLLRSRELAERALSVDASDIRTFLGERGALEAQDLSVVRGLRISLREPALLVLLARATGTNPPIGNSAYAPIAAAVAEAFDNSTPETSLVLAAEMPKILQHIRPFEEMTKVCDNILATFAKQSAQAKMSMLSTLLDKVQFMLPLRRTKAFADIINAAKSLDGENKDAILDKVENRISCVAQDSARDTLKKMLERA
jgi:hypothetical protein